MAELIPPPATGGQWSAASLVASHGTIRRENVMELCGLDRGQAYRLLKRLVTQGKLIPEGAHKGRIYRSGKGPSG